MLLTFLSHQWTGFWRSQEQRQPHCCAGDHGSSDSLCAGLCIYCRHLPWKDHNRETVARERGHHRFQWLHSLLLCYRFPDEVTAAGASNPGRGTLPAFKDPQKTTGQLFKYQGAVFSIQPDPHIYILPFLRAGNHGKPR